MADVEQPQSSPTETLVREKILHTLEIFPFISNSMLHIAIGSSTPTILWKPILDGLVKDGLVIETTFSAKNPLERNQSYNILSLAQNSYQKYVDSF